MEWRRTKIYQEIGNKDDKKIITYPQPRGEQVEALYELFIRYY